MKKKMILLLTLLAVMVNAQAGTNAVSVSAIDVAPGGTATVSIELTNEDDIRGFQFDLTLPEGISYVAESASLTERAANQSITFNEDNMRFMAVPNGSTDISGNSGVVMTLQVQAASTLAAGGAPLQATLSNIRLSDGNGQETTPANVTFDINVVEPSCTVTAEAISIEQGSTGTFEVALTNNFSASIFQMTLTLPEGIEYVSYEKGSRLAASHNVDVNEGTLTFLVSSNSNATFSGNSGTILKITVRAAATLAVASTHNVTIGSLEVTTPSTAEYHPANATCTLTIAEPTYTELNEYSTTAPVSETGANVRVTRSLKVGVWNTICLPIAMNEDQVKAAFGDDVELGDFLSYDLELEGDDIVGIMVKFNHATQIEANHPYIIKVTSVVDPFILENVDVDVDEAPCVQFTNGKTGMLKEVYGTFMGNYVAGATVPNKCLFLNDNKFYYSTGTKTMNAYRGYFNFTDVLKSVDTALSNARMRIVFNSEATTVDTVKADMKDDIYYSLQGIAVKKPNKGTYIYKGKVVNVK